MVVGRRLIEAGKWMSERRSSDLMLWSGYLCNEWQYSIYDKKNLKKNLLNKQPTLQAIIVIFIIWIALCICAALLMKLNLFGPDIKLALITFIGSSLGGVAAFIAIWVSYWQNLDRQESENKQRALDEQNAMKPFMTLTVDDVDVAMLSEKVAPLFKDPGPRYIDQNLDLHFDPRLNKELLGIIHLLAIDGSEDGVIQGVMLHQGIIHNIADDLKDRKNFKEGSYYYRMFTIKNVGSGVAHSLKVNVQKRSWKDGFVLGVDESIDVFGKITSMNSGDDKKNYKIEFAFEFSDLAGRRYSQVITCEVNANEFMWIPAPVVENPVLVV